VPGSGAHRAPSAAARRRSCVAALVVVAALGLGATSSHGHGGGAVFDTNVKIAGQRVDFDVGITYETDGEPAERAVVRAGGAGPDGQRTGTISLRRSDTGRYTGSAPVPATGRWLFTIESAFPPGTTEVDVEVRPPADRRLASPSVVVIVAGGALLLLAILSVRRRSHRAPAGRERP
jgi:hypothetical protein